MAVRRIYAQLHIAAHRHTQPMNKSRQENIFSSSLTLLSIILGLRNTEYRRDVTIHIMRYSNSTIYILFFALFMSLTSCGQKSTHEEDLIYYTTIGLQMKEVVPKIHTFWGQMKQGVLTAQQNENQKLDKTSIDNLKKYLSQNIEELNKGIKAISALSETDKDLNFKQIIIVYLTETKALQATAMPKILELLENGLDKINEQQKDALKTFRTKGEELQIKTKEIEDLSLAYQKKHGITNKELDQYGL